MQEINFPGILKDWSDEYNVNLSFLKAAYIQGLKAGNNLERHGLSRANLMRQHLTGEVISQDADLLKITGEVETEKDLLDDGDNFENTGLLASVFLKELDSAIADQGFAHDFILRHALRENLWTIQEAVKSKFKPTSEVTEKTVKMFEGWRSLIPQISIEKLEKLKAIALGL